MNKDFLKGINIALGILLVFSIIGIVSAVGFHYANEILPGTFSGNFIFDGDVNITSGNDLCVEGGDCLSDDTNWNDLNGIPAGFLDGVDDIGGGTIDCTTKSKSGGGHIYCDAGYVMTGGGSIWRSDGNDQYIYSHPSGNGWYCKDDDGPQHSCYVRCCRII